MAPPFHSGATAEPLRFSSAIFVREVEANVREIYHGSDKDTAERRPLSSGTQIIDRRFRKRLAHFPLRSSPEIQIDPNARQKQRAVHNESQVAQLKRK